MKVDKNDIKLIKAIHKQYYSTTDNKVQNGLRYVLKDVLGRYLLQVKHYYPLVSEQAQEKINKMNKKKLDIPLSRIKLHDCNVKDHIPLSKEQKKFFVNGNRYDKSFHLEHDPPTLPVVDSILNERHITDKKIENKLKPYRLCFVTVKENEKINKERRSSKKMSGAYKRCKINVKKVK